MTDKARKSEYEISGNDCLKNSYYEFCVWDTTLLTPCASDLKRNEEDGQKCFSLISNGGDEYEEKEKKQHVIVPLNNGVTLISNRNFQYDDINNICKNLKKDKTKGLEPISGNDIVSKCNILNGTHNFYYNNEKKDLVFYKKNKTREEQQANEKKEKIEKKEKSKKKEDIILSQIEALSKEIGSLKKDVDEIKKLK